jgi:hypothetical protein
LAAIFFMATANLTHLAGLTMTWVAVLGTGISIVLIIVATSMIGARRVLVLEPAIVFRG